MYSTVCGWYRRVHSLSIRRSSSEVRWRGDLGGDRREDAQEERQDLVEEEQGQLVMSIESLRVCLYVAQCHTSFAPGYTPSGGL